MSTVAHSGSLAWQPPKLPVWRFTVDEYLRLMEAGIFSEPEKVELLEGLMVPKMTRNARHDLALELADEVIRPLLPADWRLRVQSALVTPDSVPEPDIAAVRGHARSRGGRHPRAQECGLLIEVAEASLDRDRTDKGRLYANAAIPYYWILNLIDNCLEVYSQPTGPDADPRYLRREDFAAKDYVPLVLDGQEIAKIGVADLLP
jgi:Uma2 family endonuclease